METQPPTNPYRWICRHCCLARAGPCPLHPDGPQGQCLDFRLAPSAQPDDPTQPSTYAGEVITDPSRNRREQITLLDTHPFFGAG
ncbi:MAG: hypothetical protein ACKO63_14455 [Nodosilinea sp.]